MDVQAIFGLSVLMGFVFWILLAALYAWPRLRTLPRRDALMILVVPHVSRFIGLSFLVPGVVSPELPARFAVAAGYGDLIAALLALVAVLALRRGAPWAIAATWVFNLWGTADFLNAFYEGNVGSKVGAGLLGAAYFIPTVLVPGLLILHALVFRLLLRRPVLDTSGQA